MRYDFSYIQSLHAAARRERAEAMYRLILVPVIGLIRNLREARHAPRPHLARQG